MSTMKWRLLFSVPSFLILAGLVGVGVRLGHWTAGDNRQIMTGRVLWEAEDPIPH